jgi:hypothetical protein
MVWRGITAHGRTPLVVVTGNLTGIRYRDEIVQPYVIPFIQAQTNNVTFQQDNARPHVARVVRDYLTQQNVDLLSWPALSPDLSPVEHVWDEMKRRLRHLPILCGTYGFTPLHAACINGNIDIVNSLLKCNSCVNLYDI